MIKANRTPLIALGLLIVFPFVVAALDGQAFGEVIASAGGNSKFYQGLLIEVFVLGIFALSYDLIFGITGILSFGHAMFFAVGSYTAGILFTTFKWELAPTVAAVIGVAVLNALLFSIVLPRVKGVTYALVTLGIASMFHIVIQSLELSKWTGGDVGLQGLRPPEFLNPATSRLTFYYVALSSAAAFYVLYRRFVNSPTGRVCVAIRENERRAQTLGYNTARYKIVALVIASISAAVAGMLYAFYQPIVSPTTASISWTVAALLMVLMGGVGTLSGALVGAGVYILLDFFLRRTFGEASSVLLGVFYVLIVLFVPFGIVGTWQQRRLDVQRGWDALLRRVRGA